MSPDPDGDGEPLDAYSRTLTRVAATLAPSVAAVQVASGGGHRGPAGSGSAVALSADGLLVTSAHVVAGGDGGRLDLADGRQLRFGVRGRDPLSDLAVLVAEHGDLDPAKLSDAGRSGSASSSSPSGIRSDSPAALRPASSVRSCATAGFAALTSASPASHDPSRPVRRAHSAAVAGSRWWR